MDRNEKKLLYIYIFFFILIITLSYIVTMYINFRYKNDLNFFSNKIINSVKKEYPNINEDDIVKIFLNENEYKVTDENENMLRKYGIDENNIEVEYTNRISTFNISLLCVISLSILSFLIYYSITFIYNKKQNFEFDKLSKYIDHILNGKYDIDIRDNDETSISILKNKIYKITVMLKESNNILKKDKKLQEKLMSDISHQIKTPLTSLNVLNDVLYDDLSEDKKIEFLKTMERELKKIEWLIKNLLDLAKLESNNIILKKEKLNIAEVLKESISSFETLSELLDIRIYLETDANVYFNIDKKWTIEAINNLIKNAIEHKSKKINITFKVNRLYKEILIEDDGEGIDEVDIPNIFKRFYRAKNSKSDSVGLGLAFVKSIFDLQNMDVSVLSTKGKGTIFSIKEYN